MIGLTELLSLRGFRPTEKHVKLVRHKDSRLDLEALKSAGWLDVYQRFQSKAVFDNCHQIIVFIGEEAGSSRFIGVYDVGRRDAAQESMLPAGFPYAEWARPGNWHYQLSKREGFDDLEDRLVIDWGKAALAWHQWYSDRPVIEVRPRGRSLPPFRDYLRVHLSFGDLQRLMSEPDAHRDWQSALRAVGGIYLIVNTTTGEQYVGSATGNGGIWTRWADYAASGHGGNLRLKALCEVGPGCPASFRFSILETCSRTLAREEALDLEAFFKQKLGTRAFGLNAN